MNKLVPVAWIEHHKGGDNLTWERVDHPYAEATPLYTVPPTDARNEALEEAAKYRPFFIGLDGVRRVGEDEIQEADMDEYLINALTTCRDYVLKYGIAYGKEPEILLMAIGAIRELKQLRALETPAAQSLADQPTKPPAATQTHVNADERERIESSYGEGSSAQSTGESRQVGSKSASAAAPFSNCQFTYCDLPGQCISEGHCHHPISAAASDSRMTLTREEIEIKRDEGYGYELCDQALAAIDYKADVARLQTDIDAVLQLGRDFGFESKLPFSVGQVITHAKYLQKERARLLFYSSVLAKTSTNEENRLQAEVEQLRTDSEILHKAGIIEIAVRNSVVSGWLTHWEDRAIKAEAEVEKWKASADYWSKAHNKALERAEAALKPVSAAEIRDVAARHLDKTKDGLDYASYGSVVDACREVLRLAGVEVES